MQGKCVTLTIDGQTVTVPEGTSVLDAARKVNIHIPTLCYLKGVNAIGACRMCLVDVGARSLMASCVLPATQGMVVKTNTPEVREARRINLQLILSNHERTCLTCVRSRNCELQALAKDLGVEEIVYEGHSVHREIDDSSPSIIRDPNKCVLCRRCIA
ncbi:MAG: 2Fe-2S iron-sulfur cluster-binding protein, partial [Christensenellales bacterium]